MTKSGTSPLFAGFAPVAHPKIVLVVVINEPRGAASGGGSVAAPGVRADHGPSVAHLGRCS